MVKLGGHQNILLEMKTWFSIDWKNWFWTTLFDKPCSICWARKWHMSPVWYKDWSALGLPKLGCFQTDSKNLGAPCILREMAFQFSHCFPIKYQFQVNEKKTCFSQEKCFLGWFRWYFNKNQAKSISHKAKTMKKSMFSRKNTIFWLILNKIWHFYGELPENQGKTLFFSKKKKFFGKTKIFFWFRPNPWKNQFSKSTKKQQKNNYKTYLHLR